MPQDQPESSPVAPQGAADDVTPEARARAREFFAKGSEVAYALNYDYAIELYLDGLSFWPDALDEGHLPLREVALRRQAAGKKKAGMGDKSRFRQLSSKDPKNAMLRAEYMLSKDPANLDHMLDMAQAAAAADCRKTARWMADLVLESNRQKDKPTFGIYLKVRDVYKQVEAYARALQACQLALQIKPNDANLQDEMRDLSAQTTMQQGNYDSDTDFRSSIKDREAQQKLIERDGLVKSEETQTDILKDARAQYEADPTAPGKITRYVNALCSTDRTAQENEAVRILEKAYRDTKQFSFRQRMGEIRIRQWARQVRRLQAQLEKDPQNSELQQKLQESRVKSLKLELGHYKLATANYPTDMSLKFEFGQRLLMARKYDDAIPQFQEARSDPKLRAKSYNAIGQCFFYKGWYPDAVESFKTALEHVENPEGVLGKEIQYNLGRAHEADGNVEEALASFRRITQIDYNYRDVRERVDQLRSRQRE